MKKLLSFFTFAFFLFTFYFASAQSPQGTSYQAVIRNSTGVLMSNRTVSLRFSIHDSAANGSIVYQETQTPVTTAQGLVNVNVGQGIAVLGSFAGINWGNKSKFLQVELDANGGTAYTDMGTQQLMSVPYAMYANNGQKAGTAIGQMQYWNGTTWVTVAPGTNGQNLTFCNGVPQWGPCSNANAIVNLPSVTIGTQVWTSQNLSVATYRNGDPIPQVTDPTQWSNLTTGAWCWYNNDSATYAASYGRLYNWYAVNDPRGLAPSGWHVPTDAEWNKMTKYLDASVDTTCNGCWSGTTVGGQLKSTTLWYSPNTGATNSSGFSGLPGSSRNYNGSFYSIGGNGYWWSASAYDTAGAWSRALSYGNSNVYRYYNNKANGFSVRVVRD